MIKTFAVVANGSVVNMVLAEPGWIPPVGQVVEPPAGVAVAIGWGWDGSDFIPPAAVPLTWDDIREKRDNLLAQSDWTQLADAPVDAAAWADYRQQLRDIPQDFGSPDDVVWPVRP